MKSLRHSLSSFVIAFSLCSCSLFGGSQSSQSPSTSEESEQRIDETDLSVDSRITSVTRKKLVDGLSLAWEVPSEPIDGFVIRYGTDPDSMNTELTVSTSELRRDDDPVYGPVYRYVIEDVPPGKPLFVSIAARRGDLISEFTPTISETRASTRDL